MKITVSLPTFNEIASLIEKEGGKINDGKAVEISKGTAILPPVDFRLVQMRQNCADIAVKSNPANLVQVANELYEFVLNGKVEENKNKITVEKPQTAKLKPSDVWK